MYLLSTSFLLFPISRMLCLSLISVVDSRLQETALVLDMELRDWAGKTGRILGVNCLLLMDFAKAGGEMIGTSKNVPKISGSL